MLLPSLALFSTSQSLAYDTGWYYSSQTSPNMPRLASYPETIAKYVATRMEIGDETELARDDT